MNEQGEDFPHLYALRFTSRARADIEAGRAWFEQMSGEEIADEWESGLYDVVATLATLPHRSIAPENVRFQQEMRQLIVPPPLMVRGLSDTLYDCGGQRRRTPYSYSSYSSWIGEAYHAGRSTGVRGR